jgi:hypothetical protein
VSRPNLPYDRRVITARIGSSLLRFQLKAGTRVGLRTLTPVGAAVVAASVMYGSPSLVVGVVTTLLYPPVVAIGPALLATALSTSVAGASAHRLTLGLAGWIRTLPATAVAHRRAVTAGLTVVQLPILAIVLMGGLAAFDTHPSTTAPRLAGLMFLAWASSMTVLRVARGWTRVLTVVAAVLAWLGSWPGVVAAVPLVIVADAIAGPLAVGVKGRPSSPKTAVAGLRPAIRVWMTIARRALGWRIVTSWIPGLLALVPAVLFIRNNELTLVHEVGAARLAGVTAAVLVTAAMSESLYKRRPPWPWIRSLPWSAAGRVGYDALLLGVVAFPIVVATAMIESSAAIPVLITLPFVSLRGAAAIRQAPARSSGAAGPLLIEGLLAAALVALLPWMSIVFLVSTPSMIWLAAERERRQEIGRWHELHHLARGDSMSWSDA